MGKKKKLNRGREGQMSMAAHRIVVPFKTLNSTTSAAGLKVFALAAGDLLVGTTVAGATATTSARLQAIAPAFTYFRFTKLKVIVYPDVSDVSISYVQSGDGVAAPTSIAAAMEQMPSMYLTPTITVPRKLNISKRILSGQFPWYRISAAHDSSEKIQGYIFVFGAGATSTIDVEVEGEVEYKGFNNSAVALPAPLPLSDERIREIMSKYIKT